MIAMETETIDRLYLELAQVTKAVTPSEQELTNRLADLTTAAKDALESLETACEYLGNNTPIRNGSDLHSDLMVSRDRLKFLMTKGAK